MGAYYHDIGSLGDLIFKENQLGMDNPHDKLKPNMSTLIITSHTKDGVELARKHNIPEEIVDIIAQHHGDTMVAYFYHKALKQDESKEINIEDFRYPGPKPQTREAAIVMLADSTEAAVRSLKEPSKENIEEMIRNVIKGKLQDRQLEECNLTFKDLNIIAHAFSSIMMGIFHERIEYPNLELVKEEGEL